MGFNQRARLLTVLWEWLISLGPYGRSLRNAGFSTTTFDYSHPLIILRFAIENVSFPFNSMVDLSASFFVSWFTVRLSLFISMPWAMAHPIPRAWSASFTSKAFFGGRRRIRVPPTWPGPYENRPKSVRKKLGHWKKKQVQTFWQRLYLMISPTMWNEPQSHALLWSIPCFWLGR